MLLFLFYIMANKDKVIIQLKVSRISVRMLGARFLIVDSHNLKGGQMNNYEEKKQARIDRYREHAENAIRESNARHQAASQMAERFEGGQPILVGHHSEAQARRDQEKIWNNTGKAVEAQNKAEYYEAKAKASEHNTAISSDDPDAIPKLKEKLEGLREEQALKKRVNVYYRKHKTCKGCEGVSDERAAKLDETMTMDWRCGTAPFSGATLTNLNANIKRIETRIKQLEDRNENPPEGWKFSGGHVEMNLEENRVQLFFDRIPSVEFRQYLHRDLRFNWSKYHMAWQRQISNCAVRAAHTATDKYVEEFSVKGENI